MDRRLRSALVVALLVGAALWVRHQRDRADDVPATASVATAAPGKPAPVAAPRATRTYGRIAFQPCTLSAPLGADSAEAQCGTFAVPEDHAHPAGRKITLAIGWLPATGEALPDPVFMLAGGPGQGARESFPQISSAFAEVRKTHHVILVDQRGTGDSNPLACKDAKGENAFWEEGEDDSAGQGRAFAARCAKALAARADVRFYTTGDAIDDLDAVRAALGAPQLDLVGISYGTRVAQQYAQRYPKRTRTVVLDSVVPNSLVLGNEHARNLEASLALQFERCRRQPTCVALGDPRAQLDALLARVDAAPPLVRYRDGITGEAREERLTRGHIASLVRLFAYAPQIAGLLPLELKEAMAGRYEPLMALSRLVTGTLGDSIMHGMQLSVMCAEDADEMRVDAKDAGSLLGTDMITVLKAQCEVWPRGKRDPAFRKPLAEDIPVLVLSGEFDPVTPPRYGDEVVRTLPRGRHLVVRGQGHNVLPVGCMPKVFAKFVADADPKGLDVKCLDNVPYAQPFTGFNGWDP
jgi:pimeloyl-ACP methyl ester carboxylesterase